MHNPTAKTKSSNNDTCYLIMFRRKVIEKQRNNRRKIGNISISIYFRFSAARYNHLKNKLLANYLKNRGNDLATIQISAFCVASLSNNSFICKYNIFFPKTRTVSGYFTKTLAKKENYSFLSRVEILVVCSRYHFVTRICPHYGRTIPINQTHDIIL